MDDSVTIAFVLFPNVTQLDFTGPLQVLSRLPGARIHLVAKSMAPVTTDAVRGVQARTGARAVLNFGQILPATAIRPN